MKIMLVLSGDEVRETIPYNLIAETTSRSVWRTGRRKRAYKEFFTDEERRKIPKLSRMCCDWALRTGAPNELKIMPATYALFQKLGDFCASI